MPHVLQSLLEPGFPYQDLLHSRLETESIPVTLCCGLWMLMLPLRLLLQHPFVWGSRLDGVPGMQGTSPSILPEQPGLKSARLPPFSFLWVLAVLH